MSRPVVPLEIQLLVLDLAAESLHQRSPLERRSARDDFTRFALVYRFWLEPCQRILYHHLDIPDLQPDTCNRLLEALESNQVLGPFVHALDNQPGRSRLPGQRILALLSTLAIRTDGLPNLERVVGLDWPGPLPLSITQVDQARPKAKLRVLDLTIPGPGSSTDTSPLSTVFDLSGLRCLTVTCYANSSFHFLQEAPSDLEHLTLRARDTLREGHSSILLHALRRFSSLKTMNLDFPFDSHRPPATTLLASFPRLQNVEIRDGRDSGDLAELPHGHASLREVTFTSIPVWGEELSDQDNLEPLVTSLVSRLNNGNLGQLFPSLALVRLRAYSRQCLFTSKVHRKDYLNRLLYSIGPKLRSVGLTLVDDEGVEWKEEWDDE